MRTLALTLLTASSAFVVSLGASNAALAADLSYRKAAAAAPVVVAAPAWTGCYIGGNLGAGWGRADVNAAGGGGVSGTQTGFVGGAQLGCNYQFSSTGWVVGMRNMFDGTSFSTSGTIPGGALAGATAESKTSWVHTLTGRVGYAVIPAGLLYIQGGGAWARTDQTITQAGVQVAQFNSTKGGYTIGGGWEYKFTPNWSGFVEYNYMDFGTTSGTTTTGVAVNVKRDMQNLLVGVNYRFGGGLF